MHRLVLPTHKNKYMFIRVRSVSWSLASMAPPHGFLKNVNCRLHVLERHMADYHTQRLATIEHAIDDATRTKLVKLRKHPHRQGPRLHLQVLPITEVQVNMRGGLRLCFGMAM